MTARSPTSRKPLPNGTPNGTTETPVLTIGTTRFTTSELLVAVTFPLTLIAGSVFYHFSPSPATSSSYFSQKTNLFNTLFVKYGWFWTSLAFFLHVSRLRPSLRTKALTRWGLATAWWILITQWFFGAPIMDRAFLWTGGSCQQLEDNGMEMSAGKLFVTSAACKVAGGKWRGGHDLSGHVFLLTHASLFLWAELRPVVGRLGWKGVENAVVATTLGVWWWMLLMTGVYFHTPVEKVGAEFRMLRACADRAIVHRLGRRPNGMGCGLRIRPEDDTSSSRNRRNAVDLSVGRDLVEALYFM